MSSNKGNGKAAAHDATVVTTQPDKQHTNKPEMMEGKNDGMDK